ncbi:cytochrome b/b6 domain-containing protein [Dyella japonica]|uniref:Cytochrome b561 n=1 Tax=Dyella japonica TaxID=231455 RepID=A0ABV2JP48_9GAMM
MKYPLLLRVTHAAIAVGVVLQLLLSLFMDGTRHGMGWLGMELHEIVGMMVFAALSLHWILFPLGYVPYELGHYFPWFSRKRLRDLASDMAAGLATKWQDPARQEHLAGAIQGLMLLLATMLSLSGVAIYFGSPETGAPRPFVEPAKEFHEAIGMVIWFFLLLHVTAVITHLALGHRTVLSMFKFSGD